MKTALFIFLLLFSCSSPVAAFDNAAPGREFRFPGDHGSHPNFKTEWWYYTGHLESSAGESFGYQLTFFRAGLKKPAPQSRSAWAAHTVYFAHLALSDVGGRRFFFSEKAGRGALGLAGAETGGLKVWVGDWRAEARGEEQHLRAATTEVGLDLTLRPLKPPVLHGEGGYSRKAAATDAASYYYSITRLATKGFINLQGRRLPVEGASWLDREFSTSHLGAEQLGWDWFALQLADGAEIMLYLLRLKNGRVDAASSGTLIDPQGKGRPLRLADFQVRPTGTWTSLHSGATYPAGWKISIPEAGYDLTLTPTLADQELRTGGSARLIYWEGQVQIQGRRGDKPLSGRGYVELTGYAGALGGRF